MVLLIFLLVFVQTHKQHCKAIFFSRSDFAFATLKISLSLIRFCLKRNTLNKHTECMYTVQRRKNVLLLLEKGKKTNPCVLYLPKEGFECCRKKLQKWTKHKTKTIYLYHSALGMCVWACVCSLASLSFCVAIIDQLFSLRNCGFGQYFFVVAAFFGAKLHFAQCFGNVLSSQQFRERESFSSFGGFCCSTYSKREKFHFVR